MRRLEHSEPAAVPISAMNTTPLIDVMLVLLIMCILTIPIQTHAVKLDLPGPTSLPIPTPNPVKNVVELSKAGAILWNGAPLSDQAFREELRVTQQMDPIPELHVRPDPSARYDRVDQLLGMIKQEHVTKAGFVGNEGYVNVF